MKRTTILNLGAGKLKPLGYEKLEAPKFLLNVDSSYYCNTLEIKDVIDAHQFFLEGDDKSFELYLKENAFTFLERYHIPFGRIVLYRFLEHVKRTNVPYFIYLLSTGLEIGGEIDCIVPDYHTLATRIIKERTGSSNFEKEDILTTSELLNEPEMPHASIWTTARVYHFFQLEGRFTVTHLKEKFSFDGRDIYLRFFAERIR